MGALEIIPDFVHDRRGQVVRISDAAAAELARLIETDAAYIYTPAGPDRDFYNVWENETIDPATGYRGVRIPLADWALAFDARHNDAA